MVVRGTRRVAWGSRGALAALVVMTGALLGRAPSTSAAPGWREIGAPSPVGQVYAAALCPTSRLCLAADDLTSGTTRIVVSTDGGHAWRPSRLPSPPTSIAALACPTTTECLAVGVRGDPEVRSRLAIEVSRDAGASWSAAPLPAPLETAAFGNRLMAVACASALDCVAVGEATSTAPPPSNGCTPPTCVAGSSGPEGFTYGPLVLTTADGGATWAPVPVTGAFRSAAQVACTPTDACQVAGLGYTHCVPTTPGGRTCSSAGSMLGGDLGTSGATTSPPTATTGAWATETVPADSFTLNSVACPGETTCLVVGQSADSTRGHGVVLLTTDAGAVWTTRPAPAGSILLASISCVSTRDCVVTGGGGRGATPVVYQTTSAGASWSVTARFPSLSSLGDVTCAPSGTCVAVGVAGYTRQTVRGVLLAN